MEEMARVNLNDPQSPGQGQMFLENIAAMVGTYVLVRYLGQRRAARRAQLATLPAPLQTRLRESLLIANGLTILGAVLIGLGFFAGLFHSPIVMLAAVIMLACGIVSRTAAHRAIRAGTNGSNQ